MCIFHLGEPAGDVGGRSPSSDKVTIRTLQHDVEDLKRVVLELMESNERYTRDIHDLRDTSRAHAAKLRTLEQKNERLEKLLTDCKSEPRADSFKSAKFMSTSKSSRKNVSYGTKTEVGVNVENFSKEKHAKRLLIGSAGQPQAQHGTNAFYAFMSTSESHPGQHQTIVFDVDVTNIGHGYSKNSGIFTVPVTGVYVFTWAIASYPPHGDYSFTEIVVNSTPKGFIHTCSLNDLVGD